MNTSKHWFDLKTLPEDFDHYRAIHTVAVDNRIHALGAVKSLLSGGSYHVERFDDPAFAEKLREILQQENFDVVQLETLYLTPYVPVIRRFAPRALVALRAHNVEFEIWERVAESSALFKRLYLNIITPRLKRYEIEHLNDYDLLAGISSRDIAHYQRLGLKIPYTVTPIGLESRHYQPDYSTYSRPLSLSFIGSLDWMPNQDGLRWFLDEVWTPLLAPQFPELTFHIAGRTAPDWILNLKRERVKVYGEVPSASDFLNQHAVMVTPLLSGGGMRAKILEAMALGRTVISTTLGIEGIPARNGQEALLADSPQDFVAAVRDCYSRGPLLERVGRNAEAFCRDSFDNLKVGGKLLALYLAAKK